MKSCSRTTFLFLSLSSLVLLILPSASSAAGQQSPDTLVDAPSAFLVSAGASTSQPTFAPASSTTAVALVRNQRPHAQDETDRNTACETGALRGKPCRVSWSHILGESLFFIAAQHGGNIWMDADTRHQVTGGEFWANYADGVKNYRWSRWKDDDPFGVDYIGHPMMGAVTSSLYEQNDPKQRALSYENSRRYWFGRLRAMAYSAAYSAQWKIGPASEASVGNSGINYYVRARDGVYTNETGMQDFFITPIGGLAWNVGEDAIDRFFLSRVRRATRSRLLLLLSSVATPGRSAANAARFRAPYYRDLDRDTAGLTVH